MSNYKRGKKKNISNYESEDESSKDKDVDDENVDYMCENNAIQTPPTKQGKDKDEDPPSSLLPAMTQDFVKYAGDQEGVDLSKLFASPSSDKSSGNTGNDSILKPRQRKYNAQQIEKEVDDLFDLFENHNETKEDDKICTQPTDNISKKATFETNENHLGLYPTLSSNRKQRQLKRRERHQLRQSSQQNKDRSPREMRAQKRELLRKKRRKDSLKTVVHFNTDESNFDKCIDDANHKNKIDHNDGEDFDTILDSINNDILQHRQSQDQKPQHEQLQQEKIQEQQSQPQSQNQQPALPQQKGEDETNGFAHNKRSIHPINIAEHNPRDNQKEQNSAHVKDDDPFGDDPFGDDAFDEEALLMMDQLERSMQNHKQQQQQQQQHQPPPPPPSEGEMNTTRLRSSNNCSNENIYGTKHKTTTTATTTSISITNNTAPSNSNKSTTEMLEINSIQRSDVSKSQIKDPSINNTQKHHKDDEDSFGSIPDFDFEEIDRLVAERTSLSASLKSNNLNSTAPDPRLPICNPLSTSFQSNPYQDGGKKIQFSIFSRYKVHRIINDTNTFTLTLSVSQTDSSLNEKTLTEPSVQNFIHLRGEWYMTTIEPGDIFHLVSISGQYKTDISALPITLHTAYPTGSVEDDLLLVLHPHYLMLPSNISEAVSCPRRAVIKSRLGSGMLTNPSAVLGTMRHDLFQQILSSSESSNGISTLPQPFLYETAKRIVRHHSEALIGCQLYDQEEDVISQLLRIIPEINRLAQSYIPFLTKGSNSYSKLEGFGFNKGVLFQAKQLSATEESVLTPELGLKGSVDATFVSDIQSISPTGNQLLNSPKFRSIMGVELKTGHNQNPQNAHTAQLALYTTMLRVRHGSTTTPTSAISSNSANNHDVGAGPGGMLLYLNHQGHRALHVSSSAGEVKSLMTHRNRLAVQLKQSLKPRGIIQYELDSQDDDENNNNAETAKG